MRLRLLLNREALIISAAADVWKNITARDRITLAVNGSELCCAVLQQVGEYAIAYSTNLSNVHIFLQGEYIGLHRMHDQSQYFRVARTLASWPGYNYKELLEAPQNTEEENVQSVCQEYEDAIIKAGGLDLVFVEIGSQGQIGLNFGPCYLDEGTVVVNIPEHIVDEHARFFERYMNTPRRAVTMGLGTFLSAHRLLAIASGYTTADVVAQIILGTLYKDVPATFLRLHENAILYLDVNSASRLAPGHWSCLKENEGIHPRLNCPHSIYGERK